MEPPLLFLERARILSGGAVSEALDAKGGERRVTIVGNARPLFRLLARDATLESGQARLSGVPFAEAVTAGHAGLALADPPLPPDWTPERYLLESARLAGLRERDARREVDAAIAHFELAGTAHRRFSDSIVAVKRVVLLAHATLGSPSVICAESPLANLDPTSVSYVDTALERAASGRRVLCSVTSALDAERVLVERADWVVVAHGGQFVREGKPELVLAPSSRYAVTIARASDAFLSALAERGVRATPTDVATALLGFAPENASEMRRVIIELPEGASPDDIVRAAHRAGAPLVELSEI